MAWAAKMCIRDRIAAHAADIAKGLPQAVAWDREMAVARKNLDWPEQIRLALDPVKMCIRDRFWPPHMASG